MKRKAIVLCMSLVMVLGLASLVGAEPIELTILANVVERHVPEEIIADFLEQHPELDITFNIVGTPADQPMETLTTWLLAGTAPDIIVGYRSTPVEWARHGMLLDLTPYIEKYLTEEDIAEYAPAQYNYLNIDGKQYGLPKFLGTVGTIYNRKLFTEAGVPEPNRDNWTWDSLREASRKLTVRDADEIIRYGFFTNWGFDRIHYWTLQGGGYIQDPNNPDRVVIDQPEAMRAIEFLYAMAYEDQTFLTDWWPLPPKFAADQLAAFEDGYWAMRGALEGGVDFGVAEVAKGPAGRATLINNDVFVINAATKHPEEAFLFLKFIAGPYANEQRAKEGVMPAVRSVAGTWIEYATDYFGVPPTELMSFVTSAEYAQTAPIFKNHSIVDVYFVEMMDRIFLNGEAPSTVINSMVPALNAILQE